MSTSNIRPGTSEPRDEQSLAGAEAPHSGRKALIIGILAALAIGALALLTVNNGQDTTNLVVPARSGMLILIPAAFLAGVFSFLSPCTLPILPAYFAFTFQSRRENVVLMTVAFFLGLATTMVLLGATATALSQLLFRNFQTLTLIGGLIIIGFGMMSLLGKGFNGMAMVERPSASIAGSYIYGATFAFGWTACIGPILGSLLMLLTTQGIAVLQGAVLAFIYALGLGTPLILIAALFSRLGNGSAFWKFLRGRGFSVNLGFTTLYLHTTSVLSGILLIIIGILLATNQLSAINAWAQSSPLGEWAVELEIWLDRILFGRT